MYEAPEILEMGNAHELILGQKPFKLSNMDSEFATDRDERQIDIDEVDD